MKPIGPPPEHAHRLGLPARRPPRRHSGPAGGRPINVNTATEAELVALPGIGKVLVRRIIAGWPDASDEDQWWVEETGKKQLTEISPQPRGGR
jgi:hypothetical protein